MKFGIYFLLTKKAEKAAFLFFPLFTVRDREFEELLCDIFKGDSSKTKQSREMFSYDEEMIE